MSAQPRPDTMTPIERRAAITRGGPCDRVPCDLFLGDHAARVLGISVADYHRSPERMGAAQIAAYHLYRHDSLTIGPEWWGIAEALGGEVCFPEHTAPFLRSHRVNTSADLDALEPPDPRRAGRLPVFLEALSILKERMAGEVPIAVTVGGPLSTAAALRGPEALLHGLHSDPLFSHRLIEFALSATVPFVCQAALLGACLIVVDPMSSGSLLTPASYAEFSAPYQATLIRTARNLGCSVTLHVCGDNHRLWSRMADTGATTLSLDSRVDLAAVKRAVGRRIALSGNVNPRETMLFGTPSQVIRSALECLERGHDTPAGYTLGPGCSLPTTTPHENVHALMNAARMYGHNLPDRDARTEHGGRRRREIGA